MGMQGGLGRRNGNVVMEVILTNRVRNHFRIALPFVRIPSDWLTLYDRAPLRSPALKFVSTRILSCLLRPLGHCPFLEMLSSRARVLLRRLSSLLQVNNGIFLNHEARKYFLTSLLVKQGKLLLPDPPSPPIWKSQFAIAQARSLSRRCPLTLLHFFAKMGSLRVSSTYNFGDKRSLRAMKC